MNLQWTYFKSFLREILLDFCMREFGMDYSDCISCIDHFLVRCLYDSK